MRLIEECAGNCGLVSKAAGPIKKIGLIDLERRPAGGHGARYLRIPCSCMSPNEGRFPWWDGSSVNFRPTASFDLTWQGCHTYKH